MKKLMLISITLLLISFLPIFILGENSFITIHDNLDSEFVFYHTLKLTENLFPFSNSAPIEEVNMSMVKDMANRYNVITGLSDHTMGNTVPVVATVMGAKIIEKHFILDRAIGGPDASFSMNETEFTAMVKAVREAESAIGSVDYTLTEKQRKGRDFCRSLYVVEDIKAGDILTKENIRSIRPGFGMHPKFYKEIIGQKVNINIERGTPLRLELLK
jgi:pseudaminic acid synthase